MDYMKLMLSTLTAVLTGLFAQLRFSVGPIPYTMQNAGVVMTGLLLSPKYSLISMVIYILLIALGLPMASGFRGGIPVLVGHTGGYILGFLPSAAIMSYLSRRYLRLRGIDIYEIKLRDVVALMSISLMATMPTYLLGFLVFAYYALGSNELLSWARNITYSMGLCSLDILAMLFIASVVIFVPQDIFMDSLIGIMLSKELANLLRSQGVKID